MRGPFRGMWSIHLGEFATPNDGKYEQWMLYPAALVFILYSSVFIGEIHNAGG